MTDGDAHAEGAPVEILHLALGHVVARAVALMVELDVAESLAASPLSAREMADEIGVDARAAERLLACLAEHGLCAEAAGRFALTPLGAALRRGEPAHAAIHNLSRPAMWGAVADLDTRVRTGEPALAAREHYAFAHARAAAGLSDGMVGMHGHERGAVADGYPFETRTCVVDVGGGSGQLLTTILRRHSALRGVVFEQPAVAGHAQRRIEALGLRDRCSAVGGSFFKDIPADGDTYVLSHVLHDWSDRDAGAILARCRRAMSKGDRIVIVEGLAEPGHRSRMSATLDLLLLATTAGRLRTAQEHEQLLRAAGFALLEITATDVDVSLIEGAPA